MEITGQDIKLVHDMVREMAVDQFNMFGETPPFFAAIGSREPKRLEELTRVGGLPLRMEQVTTGNGPVLVGFYLASIPAQLWRGLMESVAEDIDATALIFTHATTVAAFPNDQGQGEAKAQEWYESHADIDDYPDQHQAIVLQLYQKEEPSILEVAPIDGETKELGKFTVEYGREAKGDIKW